MFAILVTVQLSHVFLITILIDQYSYDFLGFQPGRFLLCQYSLMETDYFEPSYIYTYNRVWNPLSLRYSIVCALTQNR